MFDQIGSFIKSRLDQFRSQVAQNISNVAPVAKPILQPLENTIGQGLQSLANVYNTSNPINQMVIPQNQRQGLGVQNPLTYNPVPDVVKATKGQLAMTGLATNPGMAAGAGAFSAGLQALGNIKDRKPIAQNLPQAAGQGIDFGATFAPISAAVSASPIGQKLAPAVGNKLVQRLAPNAEGFVGNTINKVGQGFVKGLGEGAAYGAVNGQNPIESSLMFGLQGGASGLIPGKVEGQNLAGGRLHPEDVQDVQVALRYLDSSEYRQNLNPTVLKDLQNTANALKDAYNLTDGKVFTDSQWGKMGLADQFKLIAKKQADLYGTFGMMGLTSGKDGKGNAPGSLGTEPTPPGSGPLTNNTPNTPAINQGASNLDQSALPTETQGKPVTSLQPGGKIKASQLKAKNTNSDTNSFAGGIFGENTPKPSLKTSRLSQESVGESGTSTNLNPNTTVNANNEPLPWENPAYMAQHEPSVAPQSVAKQSGDITMINEAQNGGNFLNRVKGLPSEVQDMFRNWVNSRHALDVQGQIAKKPFESLDAGGVDEFHKIQQGATGGIYDQLRSYFDAKHTQLQQAGIDLGYKGDYLPQLWKNSQEEIESKLGKTLTTKPSFSLESLLKDYQEGIDKGLTPRFSKVSDLVGWYESYANKALADKEFFTQMMKDGNLMPSTRAPKGWTTIDPDHFPKYLSHLSEGGEYVGTYKAPAPITDVINNYLRPGASLLNSVARFTGKAKNIALSSGIPNTGINAHGFNTLVRTLAFNNPIAGVLRGAYYMVNPEAANHYVQDNLPVAEKFIKAGMSFSSEDHAFTQTARDVEGNVFKKLFNKGLNLQESLFEKPLFQKILPAHKLAFAQESYNDLIKSGVPEKDALRQAAQETNQLFGGINTDEIGRDKNLQNIMRTFILAPDWAESNVSLGREMVKGVAHFTDPKYATYRNLGGALMASYVAANITNKALSGHWMWQNDPGNEVNIDTGSYTPQGQKRFIRVFGTAADFMRIPYELALGVAKGDLSGVSRTLRARLSVPVAAGFNLLANSDYTGNPIMGKDKFGRPLSVPQQVGGISNQVASFFGAPQPLQAGIQVASGRMTPEQGLSTALELPVRYSGGTFSPSDQQVASALGVTGKDRYDLSKTLRQQSAFSPNQMNLIKQGGQGALNQLITSREDKKAVSDASKQVEATGQAKVVGNTYVYFDNTTNSVKTIPINRPIAPLNLTGDTVTDKRLVSQYNSAITTKQNDLLKLSQMGVIPQDQAIKQINDLEAEKQKATSRASGGARKPRKPTLRFSLKPRVARIKAAKIPKITVKKVKKLTALNYKAPKFKVKG